MPQDSHGDPRRAGGAPPSIPHPAQLWRPFRFWAWAGVALLVLSAAPDLLVEYWFMASVGREGVFLTNFRAQLLLFLAGAVAFALAVALPARLYAVSRTLRGAMVNVGLWLGVLAGWLLAQRYQAFLLALHGEAFGETDPVFGRDIGFYVFTLPAVETVLVALGWCGAVASFSALVGRYDQLHEAGVLGAGRPLSWSRLGCLVTDGVGAGTFLLGLSLVGRTFLARYGLLFADNETSGVRVGADYLDLEGALSTLNLIHLSVVVEVGVVATVGWSLWRIARMAPAAAGVPAKADAPAAGGAAAAAAAPTAEAIRSASAVFLRRPAAVLSALLAAELGFWTAVVVRGHVLVSPNEPTIQVPFIQRHMDATLRGYRLDSVRAVPWTLPEDPLSVEELLASRTLRKAPLLPGWVSSLEEPPDIQHYQRIQATESKMVYGPVLHLYEQEQQLRPYYRFLSVDEVRYRVGDEKRMYVTAVRELPSRAFLGPQEWLRYWGSAALMYTHGLGLVMSPADELDAEGGPIYAVRGIPPAAADEAFDVEPRVYVGEGAKDDYVLTGVRGLLEFDHATAQSRAEFAYPVTAADGIPVSSWFRRVVLALHTGDVTAFLFSRFIDHGRTRVHLWRTPMRRAAAVAPFLFLDSNIHAFAANGRIVWMVNGLTTTDRYPYSFREVLGDKAEERAVEPFPERVINYAEDAVKVTIDAFSGEVRLYQIADDPIVEAWSRVYPGLLEPRAAMAPEVEAQLTYPLQWFHIQFDDIYKRYHQRHPVQFYNVEDLWDDADEALGSIGRGLTEFGTGDQMTFSYEGRNLLLDPLDLPPDPEGPRPEEGLQYALLKPFTPEGGRNLRSLVVAFQDPERYGELVSYQVPQGTFVPGPEQADAYIDDDAQVNQQITLWVRHGSEVMRGHTLVLPVGGDLVYVEPLWITSLQNELPQIRLVSLFYRGRTTMGTTLSEAVELRSIPEREEQRKNELPWVRETSTPAATTPTPGAP